jgi:hypothetical protein
MFIKPLNIIFVVLAIIAGISSAQENTILQININENHGLDRDLEYVEFSCQLDADLLGNGNFSLFAQESNTGLKIDCQVSYLQLDSANNKLLVRIIFPVSFNAFEEKQYLIKTKKSGESVVGDLKLRGQGTELVIENKFYQADLRKNPAMEPQSYMSGQIMQILIKMRFDQLLTNSENRLHWAPNFKRPELEYYTTIAHWQLPKINNLSIGPYLISTLRKDLAPDHPEILLTARYRFYAGLPYFRFYSSMEMIDNVWLELLRNDEMTSDSMFTHMAFERPDGEIIDIAFSERHELLKNQPIENESPWLCFYNIDRGFAFGSIRIKYDNTDITGGDSPTYQAHTQIGEWIKGAPYWNRRLIHDQLSFIPKGSCYREDNAYVVFTIKDHDKFQDIRYWAERLLQPLQVNIQYP